MIINISGIFDPLITNQLSGRLPNILAKTNPNLSLLCYDWYVACGSPGLGTQAYCMSARRSVRVCDVILGQLGTGHDALDLCEVVMIGRFHADEA